MIPAIPGSGPVLYAFTLGLVAAVNPCGFPMLPAYLAFFAGSSSGSGGGGPVRGLLAGAGVSAGFVTVFGLLGLLIEGGTRVATVWLPWIMAAVGLAMAAAGVATLLGRPPSLHLPAPRLRPGRSALAMAVYGAAYATGSLSCSLPLFLAAVSGSFTGQGFLAGFSTYLAYALGMALFVSAAAVLTSTAGGTLLRHFKTTRRWVPVLSGITLSISGSYLSYYWLAQLVDPAGESPVTASVALAQGWIASALGAQPLLSATVLGAVVLTAIALTIRRTLTEPQQHHPPAGTTPETGKGSSKP